jgi:subtilisin family serine protease
MFFVAGGERHEVVLTKLEASLSIDPAKLLAALRGVRAMAARLGSSLRLVQLKPADPRRAAMAKVAGASRPRRPSAAGGFQALGAMTLATSTAIVEGARRADLAAARNFGASVLNEGYDGKALLGVDSVDRMFRLVHLLEEREVGAVAPNFLRRTMRRRLSAPLAPWAHAKIGVADAWAITQGSPEIRVAVLDEGVDTSHPALKPAVVAERDFIGDHGDSAMPDGDDAHGTSCAGIIASRDAAVPGIAPKCSLMAARIALSDGNGGWVFDDYATADAIDWAWRQGAAVLSNSWGGGAPSDAISRALGRARTQGRGGDGAVVAIAAGNDGGAIQFPGNLPGYVTVGASTPADERKTKRSSDGESWWASCYGPTLALLAPGVFISTTDIAGPRGYADGDFTATFNGTSAATPHVAACAALMLSANAHLTASDVRRLLQETAARLDGQTDWTPRLGWGRLDAGRAVAAAKLGVAARSPLAPSSKPTRRTARKSGMLPGKKASRR